MLRRHVRLADHGVDMGIIITPMLDMAFQLLAFFIMTYHPPAGEGMVDVSLLPAVQTRSHSAGPAKAIVVILQAAQKRPSESLQPGQLKALYLQRPSAAQPQLIATLLTSEDVTQALKGLANELALSLARSEEKDLPLRLEADRALQYGALIAVQDVVKAAGFKVIEFQVR